MLLGSTLANLLLVLGSSRMRPGALTNISSTESLNLSWSWPSMLKSWLSMLKDRPVTADERRQARLEKGLHVWGIFVEWICRDLYNVYH